MWTQYNFVLDRYGRAVEDLRVTLTHACNFECFFCHMEGENVEGSSYLSPQEIYLVAKVAKEFGVTSVKLTGGEPTLRRDLTEIVRLLKSLGLEVSMTTNGFLLDRLAHELRDAGLDRVNVSLHAANRETFRKVTGVDAFERVINGVESAIKAGLRPLKLNFVINGVNYAEWRDFLDLAVALGVDAVNFIELHPVGKGASTFTFHRGLDEIEEFLRENGRFVSKYRKHNRPVYEYKGVRVALVKPYSNPLFCAGCNRIRLTADGKLKSCLYRNDRVVDVVGVLRYNVSEEEKIELLRRAIGLLINIREPNFIWRLNAG